MATRDELREHLVAAIEAAPEFPKEDRHHLADVFLDQLNAQYELVPRGAGKRSQPAMPARRPQWSVPWLPLALLFAFLIFVVSAGFLHHFPIFLLFVLAVFFFAKSSGMGMRRARRL